MTTATAPEKKTIRAIYIDAVNRKVTEVEITPDFDTYYRLIGCNCITTGYCFPNGDILFVDDNGYLDAPKYFFRIPGIDYDYAGNGLIVGTDPESDEETDAKTRSAFFGVMFARVTEEVA